MSDSALALATYGTLAPGSINHEQLAGLSGRWTSGTVRGVLHEDGWGAAHGFPGLHLAPGGPAVEVHLFLSADLPAHWARLDAFEGAGYVRRETVVATSEGPVAAFIYELASDP